jgi:ABC-type lipoprotein release transport system permease subunit
MATLLRIAVRNLWQHRTRTLLLGVAIVIVTLLLTVVVGLSRSMQATMLRSATTLITGHVNVAGFYKVSADTAAPVVTDYKALKEVVLREVPEIRFAIDRARGFGRIVSDTNSQWASLGGVSIGEERGFAEVLDLLEGSVDGLEQPHTALIFETHAKRLGVKVGDELTIRAPTFRGVNNSVSVRVVAIAEDVGFLSSFIIYVPADTVRELYAQNENTTGAIHLYLDDLRDAPEVATRLRAALGKAGWDVMPADSEQFWKKFDQVRREDWTGQKIDVTAWQDEIRFMSWTVDAVDVLGRTVVAVLLVIIVIGIMNTMWMAIRERTREIGTLRAIGMHTRQVLGMLMLEAAVLSSVATGIGALVGAAVAATLELPITSDALKIFLMSDTLVLDLSAPSMILATVVIIGVTTLGAVYPSWRAARMRPVTAIHEVG